MADAPVTLSADELKNLIEEGQNEVQEERVVAIKRQIKGLLRLKSVNESSLNDLKKEYEKKLSEMAQRNKIIDDVIKEVAQGKVKSLLKVKFDDEFLSEKSTETRVKEWLRTLQIDPEDDKQS